MIVVNMIIVCQVMNELGQYDSTDRGGCGGPIMLAPRRGRRSFCGGWYWPIFPGGSSSKEVFDVSSFELSSSSSSLPIGES